MAVYRFRVSFEEYDDIHRDIEIRSGQNFELFHKAIQESIGFDASKPASFYMSNDNWKKGQEIYFDPSNSQPNGKLLMKDARLSDYIADPHQKIYYAFDQPSQWTFYIELFKILPDGDPGKNYPICVKTHGDAPKQYIKIETPKGVPDPEFMDDDLFNDILVDEDDPLEEGAEETSADEDATFGNAVDEDEYDNIEESSDEESERE